MDVNVFYIALAAFAGAIVAAALGYLDNVPEPWNTRKFIASVLRGLIGAVLLAIAYNFTEINAYSYLIAFVGGAGVDVLGNRVSAAIATRTSTPTVTVNPQPPTT